MKQSTTPLQDIIASCLKKERGGQRALYKRFYSLGMSVTFRFTTNRQEAEEMLNDGFYKIFTKLDQYDSNQPFEPWFKRIMVNTAIDYYRSQQNFKNTFTGIKEGVDVEVKEEALSYLAYEDLLKAIQYLSPARRTVFNLFVIDGLKHQEIAEKLNISIGSSKSNLGRAKEDLRTILKKLHLTKNS